MQAQFGHSIKISVMTYFCRLVERKRSLVETLELPDI